MPPSPPPNLRFDNHKLEDVVIQKLKPFNDSAIVVTLGFKRDEMKHTYGPGVIRIRTKQGMFGDTWEEKVVWIAAFGYNLIGYAESAKAIRLYNHQAKELGRL